MFRIRNKYKNTLVGFLERCITFVPHLSPSCYVTLRTQVIRLHSGDTALQKTDSGVFIIIYQHFQPVSRISTMQNFALI